MLAYGVTVGRLNEAVRRNRDRFPIDFMFQLTKDEFESLKAKGASNLKSQFAISSSGWGGRRTPPYAFTDGPSDSILIASGNDLGAGCR